MACWCHCQSLPPGNQSLDLPPDKEVSDIRVVRISQFEKSLLSSPAARTMKEFTLLKMPLGFEVQCNALCTDQYTEMGQCLWLLLHRKAKMLPAQPDEGCSNGARVWWMKPQ